MKKSSLGIFIAVGFVITLNFGEAFSMQGIQNSKMRLGLGLASLAVKECPGYQLGAGVERMYGILNATTDQQKRDVTLLAEEDAKSFLTAQGKTICEVAQDMVRPGALLEKS